MKSKLLTLSAAVLLAGNYSITLGQHNISNNEETFVYSPLISPGISEPNTALFEMFNDSMISNIKYPIENVYELKNNEPKSDLADPNHDLKTSDSGFIALTANFKKEAEDNILKNENCLSDLEIQIQDKKGADSTVLKSEVELLEQRNSVMKSRLSEYYKYPGSEEFSSFKNSFDYDMELVTNGILEISVDY